MGKRLDLTREITHGPNSLRYAPPRTSLSACNANIWLSCVLGVTLPRETQSDGGRFDDKA